MEKKKVERKKSVHADHRKRVRKNVLENGFSQLEEHRLLELLLFYSIPQGDTNELAHNLINEFGSLESIFNQDCDALQRVKGVGEYTAVMLVAMGEAFRRYAKAKPLKKRRYKTTDDYIALAINQLGAEEKEIVVAFCFDEVKSLKKTVTISQGDKLSSEIDVRKVVRTAMESNATYIVLSHNHPENDCQPSASDIDSTRSLCVTLRKLGVLVADHIIVGEDGKAFSMQSDKMLSQMFL